MMVIVGKWCNLELEFGTGALNIYTISSSVIYINKLDMVGTLLVSGFKVFIVGNLTSSSGGGGLCSV
jgi:hypothetical protein